IDTAEKFSSLNPARKRQVVGRFPAGTPELARRAIAAASAAYASWSATPVAQRVELLIETARLIRENKYRFAACMVFEVGKTWAEADADVAEAIDFAEFYAREMLRFSKPQSLVPVPGERNNLCYIPLGVGAVIPPWNFPLAIMAGMTLASVVTGNTAVLKPSSDSPTVAYKFFEVLEQAGMPPGVVNFLPGPGGSAGESLVSDPRTRFIAFTGSKDAGLRIHELASRRAPGQLWIKRTILEMGGKDSILVDSEADLDLAVEGVVVSAFGFQGQKCSACSRAIVVDTVYDAFLARLKERVEKIAVGAPEDPGTDMGPVINSKAKKSILGYIEAGKKEGRLLAGGREASGDGHYLEPTVIADVPPKARIAQEEIFGPVLAVIRAGNFDEALEIANNTEYGLTGSVYTKNRRKIERAVDMFHVGNLYFNRKCTGALVGGHPFGGFNMSGTDSKAGGPDYLLHFLQAKTIAEKIVP
ncbi:MAG: L-glutamate gamma-semialdehyde dehydrogenase, partial [Terriglobia bacterium]